ncbi:MAG TPA: hypothetical protein VFM25_03910 [Verrucomicrobiae bacterium]|nr:hypothetical protein [Verrucomicrobiae bacterium]
MEFNNRGILFRNFRKKQPKHPDVVGEATVDGRKYKIAGWLKPGKRAEFHSLAFTEEQAQPEHCGAMPSAPVEFSESPAPDSDIPF